MGKIRSSPRGNKKIPPGKKRFIFDDEKKAIVKNLFSVGCTNQDVAAVFGISTTTLTKQEGFKALRDASRAKGTISLRKKLYEQALVFNNDSAMRILSKSELSMHGKSDEEIALLKEQRRRIKLENDQLEQQIKQKKIDDLENAFVNYNDLLTEALRDN